MSPKSHWFKNWLKILTHKSLSMKLWAVQPTNPELLRGTFNRTIRPRLPTTGTLRRTILLFNYVEQVVSQHKKIGYSSKNIYPLVVYLIFCFFCTIGAIRWNWLYWNVSIYRASLLVNMSTSSRFAVLHTQPIKFHLAYRKVLISCMQMLNRQKLASLSVKKWS